jgi:hypothetical protein
LKKKKIKNHRHRYNSTKINRPKINSQKKLQETEEKQAADAQTQVNENPHREKSSKMTEMRKTATTMKCMNLCNGFSKNYLLEL